MSVESKSSSASFPTEKELAMSWYESRCVIVRVWTSSVNRLSSSRGENVGHVSIQTSNNYISLWPKSAELSSSAATSSSSSTDHNSSFSLTSPISAPSSETKRQDKQSMLIGSVAYKLQSQFIDDVRLENDRRPELTFYFYSLDWQAIDRNFAKFKESPASYSLFGLRSHSFNCAQLAWQFLLAGGIGKLLSSSARVLCCKRGSKDGVLSKQELARGISYGAFFQGRESSTALGRGMNDSSHSSEMLIPIQNPDKLAVFLQNAKKNELNKEEYQPTQDINIDGEWRPLKKSDSSCVIS